MSTTQLVTNKIKGFSLGEPFSTSYFLKLGSRAAVDKSLSRLVQAGSIERITNGVYLRPKKNRFIGSVKPEVSKVIQTIAKANGETIQIHGAEAARRFKLSTQMPTQPVYYTSGSSRTLTVGKMKIKLVHAAQRKLQLAGKKSGLALSALWFLGKEGLHHNAVEQVCSKLKPQELQELLAANKPAWMSTALDHYTQEQRIG
ncbi:MAG: hypothetical protein COB61_002980 [Thiotrichales bacterium]|nr:hypothetical protein [Thiotrichales bacterium]